MMQLVESEEAPESGALEEQPGLWLVFRDDHPGALGLAEAASRIRPRTDLPPSHPMSGKRVLARVPAGSPDLEVTAQGIRPLGPDGKPYPEPGLGRDSHG